MPLPPWTRSKLFRACAVLFTLVGCYLATCVALDPRVDVSKERIESSMAQAADYLVAHNEASGRFIYEVDAKGESLGKGYNVLRHAGTIYSLSMYYELRPSPVLRDVILRAARYLKARHLGPVKGLPVAGIDTIFSLPGEESGRSRVAKLGGAGLGLVALVRARALDEALISIEELRRLAGFILFMQQEDGSFRSKYSETAKWAYDFNSLYYPGEAILALASLYKIDRDPRWLDAALLACKSLIERQQKRSRLPNDHWLMIAIAELLPLYDEADEPPVSKDDLISHAVALGDTMMFHQRWSSRIPGMTGAYTPGARSTPSATRLEGIVAMYQALPETHSAREEMRESIHQGVSFLLACQEVDGPNKGAFRKALRSTFGGDDWRNVRIDYVQHALSALIGYQRVAYDE